MPRAFSPHAATEVERIRSRYPTNLAALIPTLLLAQKEFGYLGDDALSLVAETLDVPVTKVIATATFYTMLNKEPVGKFHVQICKNISCFLRNSDAVTRELRSCLGVAPGETTEDGLFTLTEVECLAACGRAPVVQINEEYHEWQTPESMRGVIDGLRNGATSNHGADV